MVEVGSMEVVGLFKDMNLFSSLTKMKTQMKSVAASVKSTGAEIVRFTTSLKNLAIAGAGFGIAMMFASFLTSVPYLQGAFTRIKTDVMLLWWSLAKHLKPVLDLVADAIHALRTGDWEGFKTALKGAVDLIMVSFQWLVDWLSTVDWHALLVRIANGMIEIWDIVKKLFPDWYVGYVEWLASLYGAILTLDWSAAWQIVGDGLNTVWNDYIYPMLPTWLQDMLTAIGNWIQSAQSTINTTFGQLVDVVKWFDLGLRAAKLFWDGFNDWMDPKGSVSMTGYTGGHGGGYGSQDVGATTLPYTGLFWGKAGETVSMGGTSNESGGGNIITNDFNGATFNLADGMDIDMFVDLLNRKQAEKSVWEGF